MTIIDKLMKSKSFNDRVEPLSIHTAVSALQRGYSRSDDGTTVVHRLVGGVDGVVALAQFEFNRTAASLGASMRVNIEAHTHRRGFRTITVVKLPLFADADVQAKFNELCDVAYAAQRGPLAYVDVDKLTEYNELTGFDGRIVEVGGLRFGRVLTNAQHLPLFAQQLVLLDKPGTRTGQRVLELARDARKILNPELANVKTIADMLPYIDDPEQLTSSSEKLSYGFTRVAMVNDKPLVLTGNFSETLLNGGVKLGNSLHKLLRKLFPEDYRR